MEGSRVRSRVLVTRAGKRAELVVRCSSPELAPALSCTEGCTAVPSQAALVKRDAWTLLLE